MGIQVLSVKDMPPRPLHTFMYGPVRSGKTTAAATWPAPVFLSAGNEGGDTSLRFTAADAVIRISSVQDMKDAIAYINAYGASKHGWRTIVLDSMTYYSDIFVGECTKNGEKYMAVRDWGTLDLHLQKWLMPTLMKMSFHVVYIALEEIVRGAEGEVKGYTSMLYGKSKDKLPGSCDLILRSATRNVRNSQTQKMETNFFFQTVTMDNSPSGGRFGNAFADGVIPQHFGAIAQRIGPYINEPVPNA